MALEPYLHLQPRWPASSWKSAWEFQAKQIHSYSKKAFKRFDWFSMWSSWLMKSSPDGPTGFRKPRPQSTPLFFLPFMKLSGIISELSTLSPAVELKLIDCTKDQLRAATESLSCQTQNQPTPSNWNHFKSQLTEVMRLRGSLDHKPCTGILTPLINNSVLLVVLCPLFQPANSSSTNKRLLERRVALSHDCQGDWSPARRHHDWNRSTCFPLFWFLLACLSSLTARGVPSSSLRKGCYISEAWRRQAQKPQPFPWPPVWSRGSRITRASRRGPARCALKTRSSRQKTKLQKCQSGRMETAAQHVSSTMHQMTLKNRWRRSEGMPEGSVPAQMMDCNRTVRQWEDG